MNYDMKSAALITIDVQADTLDGQPLEVPGTSASLPRIQELAIAFREAAQPIVHVVRLYKGDGSNAEPFRRELVSGDVPVLRPGTPGRLLADGLLDSEDTDLDDHLLLAGGFQYFGANEAAMYKPRWGAFFGTGLEGHLRERGVTTVVFAGCNFPNCPRTSIYQASERDFRVIVATDAVSGLYPQGEKELIGMGAYLASASEIVASTRAPIMNA
ncbi:cysteine hydrolase family protein [Plantibacter sp. Mn2098]|uniref:cysteine hydrolase family protein n=1 Tax=Plantibacter sp. Mn2098 TaxID=3395266 RepID=UPI003BD3DA6F